MKTWHEDLAGGPGMRTWREDLVWGPGGRTWYEDLAGGPGMRTWREDLVCGAGGRTWYENLESAPGGRTWREECRSRRSKAQNGSQTDLTNAINIQYNLAFFFWQARRILYCWGDKGVGKTKVIQFFQSAEWWSDRGVANPRCLDCSSLTSIHHFLGVYKDERIAFFNFERESVAKLTPDRKEFILDLTDVVTKTSGKHKGTSARVAVHVVVFANEPPPAQWDHKEVWLLKLRTGA